METFKPVILNTAWRRGEHPRPGRPQQVLAESLVEFGAGRLDATWMTDEKGELVVTLRAEHLPFEFNGTKARFREMFRKDNKWQIAWMYPETYGSINSLAGLVYLGDQGRVMMDKGQAQDLEGVLRTIIRAMEASRLARTIRAYGILLKIEDLLEGQQRIERDRARLLLQGSRERGMDSLDGWERENAAEMETQKIKLARAMSKEVIGELLMHPDKEIRRLTLAYGTQKAPGLIIRV